MFDNGQPSKRFRTSSLQIRKIPYWRHPFSSLSESVMAGSERLSEDVDLSSDRRIVLLDHRARKGPYVPKDSARLLSDNS
jgi:hypothetical protein